MNMNIGSTALRGATAAIAFVLLLNTALAAPVASPDSDRNKRTVPNAASLLRFYPIDLASSPAGTVDDQDVWLAKLQGLLASAPTLLQQSLLMSQTTDEFVANLGLLEQVQEGALKRGIRSQQNAASGGRVTAQVLGDVNNNIYVPLTPCRIMDTRFAIVASGVRGPLTGGTLYQLPGYASGSYNAYGGQGGDCGLNATGGVNTNAIAIVITILNPNADAYLGVSPNPGTVLSNVALNFTHGQGLSTLYIVPQDGNHFIYFAMPTGLTANLIFDVVGYFAKSDATALECNTAVSSPVTIAAFSTGNATVPACGSGFTQTSILCLGSSGLMSLYATNTCSFLNSDNISHTATGFATCCRVPGK